MVRSAPLILAAVILAGCQADRERSNAAAVSARLAQLGADLPDLDPSCTQKMGRVLPKQGEPWVIFDQRWNAVADNRDRASADCDAWWADYRAGLSGRGGQ